MSDLTAVSCTDSTISSSNSWGWDSGLISLNFSPEKAPHTAEVLQLCFSSVSPDREQAPCNSSCLLKGISDAFWQHPPSQEPAQGSDFWGLPYCSCQSWSPNKFSLQTSTFLPWNSSREAKVEKALQYLLNRASSNDYFIWHSCLIALSQWGITAGGVLTLWEVCRLLAWPSVLNTLSSYQLISFHVTRSWSRQPSS